MTTPLTILTEARNRAGLTQSDLARQLGIPRQHIQAYEAGTRNLRDEVLIRRLARALHLDREAIYAHAGVIPPDIKAALTDGNMTDEYYHRVRCALGI